MGHKLATVVCCLMLGLYASAFAQTLTVVADEIPNSAPSYYEHERKVARTASGTLMVIWKDNADQGQMVYSLFDDSFGTWSPAAPISAAGEEADKGAIVRDVEGVIHAAWQQKNTPDDDWHIYYANYIAGTWTTPLQVDSDTLDAQECSIEIASDGRIFVVWNTDDEADGSEWILCSVSSNNGASWGTPDTLSSPDGVIDGGSVTNARTAIFRGSNGKMAATWHENVAGREREIFFNQYDGSSWKGEVVISDTTAIVARHWYPNVIVDSQDNIYVTYNDDQGGSDPRHVLLGKKAWDAEWTMERDTLAVATDDFSLASGMAVDENDVLYVGYRRDVEEDTTDIEEIAYIASDDGGSTWSDPIVISRANHDAAYVTFAARTQGVLDASWRESSDEFIRGQDTTAVVHVEIPLGVPVSVAAPQGQTPTAFALQPNYPNPFNPSTRIQYDLSVAGEVKLDVLNILGQRIRTLVSQRAASAGVHTVEWDGRDDAGNSVSGGVYFYRLEVKTVSGENSVLTRKMLLLK